MLHSFAFAWSYMNSTFEKRKIPCNLCDSGKFQVIFAIVIMHVRIIMHMNGGKESFCCVLTLTSAK